jgi:predicted nucleic acid-binding protein
VGLILDSSLFIADERERFRLSAWLRARPPEPVAMSVITLAELFFGIEVDEDVARSRRRRRWLRNALRRVEIVPYDQGVARAHGRIWGQLCKSWHMIGS